MATRCTVPVRKAQYDLLVRLVKSTKNLSQNSNRSHKANHENTE